MEKAIEEGDNGPKGEKVLEFDFESSLRPCRDGDQPR